MTVILSKPTPQDAMAGTFGGKVYNKKILRTVIFSKNANLLTFFTAQNLSAIYVNGDLVTNVITDYLEDVAISTPATANIVALKGHQFSSIKTDGDFQIIYSD